MTFREALLSLQVETEVRVGYLIREQERTIRAQQDAAWDAAIGAARAR